jgi:hypothetical protein
MPEEEFASAAWEVEPAYEGKFWMIKSTIEY